MPHFHIRLHNASRVILNVLTGSFTQRTSSTPCVLSEMRQRSYYGRTLPRAAVP